MYHEWTLDEINAEIKTARQERSQLCTAVIDTNVFVSALITKNPESPTRLVYDFIDDGEIIPLYNDEIITLGIP